MSLINKSVEFATERFSSSVWRYFNLWSYFDTKLKHAIASRKTHSINSCLDFYKNIYNGSIKHGDRVILKDFFISEWVPRAAGGLARMVSEDKLTIQDYNSLPTSFKPNSANLNRQN